MRSLPAAQRAKRRATSADARRTVRETGETTNQEVAADARFGRLVIVGETEPYLWRGRFSRRRWLCVCDCGREAVIREDSLKYGGTSSCGCLKEDVSRERMTRHGGRSGGKRSAEYEAWQAMLHRQSQARVCRRWSSSRADGFLHFVADVGTRPSPRHRLVRLNDRGAFSPSNCVWSDTVPRRGVPRRPVILRGREFTLHEVARRYSINYALLCKRLQRGWQAELAVQRR
jgi:hypothetical protein